MFLILIPLQAFFLSAYLVPDSKQEASGQGWYSCMLVGKTALTPLVLWAVSAYYAYLLKRPSGEYPKWVFWGLFHGALAAGGCAIIGLYIIENVYVTFFIVAVPLLVSAGYAWCGIDCGKRARVSEGKCFAHLLFEVPFWWVGGEWSKRVYGGLPETSSDCFVVTAASRGHSRMVGPFLTIERQGHQQRTVNRQLVTFWRFEEYWRARSPSTHRRFRRFYNRAGPRLARRIRNPWLADMVYISLKPAEWGFRAWNRLSRSFRGNHPSTSSGQAKKAPRDGR